MTEILCAIRTQTAWDAMTAPEKAVFDYHYTDLTSAITAIAAVGDLVTASQNWTLRGFNDWAAGLVDSITIPVALTTSAAFGVHITSEPGHAPSETGLGVDGFHLKKSLNNGALIKNDSSNCSVKNIGLINTGTLSSRAYWETAGNNVFTGNYCKDSNGSENINGAFCVDSIFPSTLCANNIIISRQGILTRAATATKNIFNNTVIATAGATGNTYGINSKAGAVDVYRNNLIYGFNSAITDFGTTATGSHNAGSDATIITTGIGTVFNLLATDFNDYANGDYRIAAGSQLDSYDGFDTLAQVPLFFGGTARSLPMLVGACSTMSVGVAISRVYISNVIVGQV